MITKTYSSTEGAAEFVKLKRKSKVNKIIFLNFNALIHTVIIGKINQTKHQQLSKTHEELEKLGYNTIIPPTSPFINTHLF